jgi:hypothetical protein
MSGDADAKEERARPGGTFILRYSLPLDTIQAGGKTRDEIGPERIDPGGRADRFPPT